MLTRERPAACSIKEMKRRAAGKLVDQLMQFYERKP
jgi:hypothetical protein